MLPVLSQVARLAKVMYHVEHPFNFVFVSRFGYHELHLRHGVEHGPAPGLLFLGGTNVEGLTGAAQFKPRL